MSGTKVNDYSTSDTNIETLMLTTDQIFKGKCECTLTEMDTTTVPEIAAGSYIEVNGTLFKFDSDESISTTDPVTSSTVADGTVYVMIVPSTDTCTAAFTATAPTWSDSKQGWYGTGDYASYRYIGYCFLSSSVYACKKLLKDIFDLPHIGAFFSSSEAYSGGTPVYPSLGLVSSSNQLGNFNNTISIDGGDILIPVSGLYSIDVSFRISGIGATDGAIYVRVNGVAKEIYYGYYPYNTILPVNSSVYTLSSFHLYLSSGDLVDFGGKSQSSSDSGNVSIVANMALIK